MDVCSAFVVNTITVESVLDKSQGAIIYPFPLMLGNPPVVVVGGVLR